MTAKSAERIRLRPADSFDLIRLIARSQSDPRKAVAELVQNSLDAGASTIRLAWSSMKDRRALAIRDDGRGVFPELERPEALRRIVSTIGHSHKAHLTPAERHQQMTLGKYGIGLLGFWSVAAAMEIRTRVAGSETWTLRLGEEERDAVITRARASRLPMAETYTEIVLAPLHEHAASQLKPRRIAAYLAGELRGQLLQRDVRLEIHDHVARGRAQKLLLVRPQPYLGIPVTEVQELEVYGFASARVELYLVPDSDERRGSVALACGGSTVLDDIALIDGTDAPREPWSSGRFEGVIDFPDLEVAPSTRRGFVPNDAARAFITALPALEARCRDLLADEAERRRQAEDAQDARELRRVFRRMARVLPHYSMLDVKDGRDRSESADTASDGAEMGEAGLGPGVSEQEDPDAGGPAPPEPEPDPEPLAEPSLFPPGPLATVELRPRRSVIALEGSRRLRARPLDSTGREIDRAVVVAWTLRGPGRLDTAGSAATYVAPSEPAEATVTVLATENGMTAEASATVRVSEAVDPEAGSTGGVPEPEPVAAPTEAWRSRIEGSRWLYNTAHPDYREVQQDPKRRLRYLAHLLAKEIVLRNFGEPSHAALLERMVQVLTYIEGPGTGRTRG